MNNLELIVSEYIIDINLKYRKGLLKALRILVNMHKNIWSAHRL